MGWGNITRAIGGVIRAVPGAEALIDSGALGLGALGLGGLTLRSYTQSANRSGINKERTRLSETARLAREEQQKAIAAESVRLQEEQARKRTLFGGEVIGKAAERKSLLGL